MLFLVKLTSEHTQNEKVLSARTVRKKGESTTCFLRSFDSAGSLEVIAQTLPFPAALRCFIMDAVWALEFWIFSLLLITIGDFPFTARFLIGKLFNVCF